MFYEGLFCAFQDHPRDFLELQNHHGSHGVVSYIQYKQLDQLEKHRKSGVVLSSDVVLSST